MTEKLFQYIWQFRYYQQTALCLQSGESVQVIFPGNPNPNQGPDFLHARIRIADQLWIGHVELHLLGSDWKRHAHGADANYRNVILHVVVEDDLGPNEINLPTLVLGGRIPGLLLDQYAEWMRAQTFIPCERNFVLPDKLLTTSWLQRLLLERLQRRGRVVVRNLKQSHSHWEEVFWWMVAGNFGSRVNSVAFESIARTVPVTLLAKHKNQAVQLEALLMGQANLLGGTFTDDYPKMLKKEYGFLKKKYHLLPVYHAVHFLRMRPENFPTVRLSQLAALIRRSSQLFSLVRDASELKELVAALEVQANDYWHYHYVFDEASVFKIKCVGKQMIDNLIINTVVTALYVYGSLNRQVKLVNKSLQWLEQIPPEKNAVIAGYRNLGLVPRNAADTQAMLELKSQYCHEKNCLRCAFGNAFLKNWQAPSLPLREPAS